MAHHQYIKFYFPPVCILTKWKEEEEEKEWIKRKEKKNAVDMYFSRSCKCLLTIQYLIHMPKHCLVRLSYLSLCFYRMKLVTTSSKRKCFRSKLHLDNWFCAKRKKRRWRRRQQQEKKDPTNFVRRLVVVVVFSFVIFLSRTKW